MNKRLKKNLQLSKYVEDVEMLISIFYTALFILLTLWFDLGEIKRSTINFFKLTPPYMPLYYF